MSEEKTTEEPTVEDYINESLGVKSIEETKPADKQEATATSPDGDDEATEESEENEAETEDEAESEEQEASGEDESEDKPKPKKRLRSKRDPEKRIRQLVAERNAERDRITALEAQIDLLSKQSQQPSQAAEKPQEPQAPRQEDFADYAEYLEARSAWAADQRFEQRMAEVAKQAAENQKKQSAQQRENELTTQAKALFAKGTEEFEDFEEVAADPDLPITEAMTVAMLESEIGHQVQYHLGSNPDEAQRISQLNPVQQVRAMALLEASLQKPKRAKRKTTSAPEPIKPVGGKGGTKPKVDPDEMPIEQYMEEYNSQFYPGR